MIFDITPDFANELSSEEWCLIFPKISRNYHFINRNPETYKIIQAKIAKGGDFLKNIFKSFVANWGFNINKQLEEYLTKICIDKNFNKNDFKFLTEIPAYLICENSNYEWDIYIHFIDIYTRDSQYKEIFKHLQKCAKRGNNALIAENNGGSGQLIPTFEALSKRYPEFSMLNKKCCFLFDRDTDSDLDNQGNFVLSKEMKNVFKFLNEGKDHLSTSRSDIYSLTQKNYIWHMWYKRMIENYFPFESYKGYTVNVSNWEKEPVEKRDYFKVCSANCKGYDKSGLKDIARITPRDWFEKNTVKFSIDHKDYNEIQLFLLKLVKIV